MIPVTTASQRWHAPSSSFSFSRGLSGNLSILPSFASPRSPSRSPSVQALAVRSSLPALTFLEKILLVIDFLQVFSLLWIAAQPWPWPYIWVTLTRPLMLASIDVFSFSDEGALAGRSQSLSLSRWGQMEGQYLLYSLVFALFALALSLTTGFFLFLDRLPLDRYGYVSWLHRNRSHCLFLCLLAVYVFYLPCSLAVSRLCYCERGRVAADPSVACFSAEHLIFLFVELLCVLPLFVLAPVLFYRLISQNVVYADALDHEKKLQCWELSFMLRIDDYWLDAQVWLLSSLRRSAAYLRLHTLLLKAVLLVLFVCVRSDFSAQSGLFALSLSVFFVYYLVFAARCGLSLPFRSGYSNIIFVASGAMLLCDAFFGFANACGARNAVTVGSTESLFLIAVNGSGVVVMFLVFLSLLISSRRRASAWPTLRTLTRVTHNTELCQKAARWVETIREAQRVLIDFLLSPPEIADINGLEESARALRICWLSARTMGSIFEPLLSETLEQLLVVHTHAQPSALRRFDHWDTAFRETVERPAATPLLSFSISHSHIGDSIAHSTQTPLNAFSLRAKQYALMNPRKRRILVKLLALKALQGKHRHDFNMETAMREKKINEKKRNAALRREKREERELLRQRLQRQWLGFSREGFSFEMFRVDWAKRFGGKNTFSLLDDSDKEEGDIDEEESDSNERRDKRNGKEDEEEIESRDYTLDAAGRKIYTAEFLKRQKAKRIANLRLDIPGHDVHDANAEKEKDAENAQSSSSANENENASDNESETVKRFSDEMVEEARKMIARLQQRTELALNKHSRATRQIFEQQKQQLLQSKLSSVANANNNNNKFSSDSNSQSKLALAAENLSLSTNNLLATNLALSKSSSALNLTQLMNASTNTLSKLGLSKIATMDLIKETADEEEQKDLEDLFHLWDVAISLYEQERFPGDYEKLDTEVENWYSYRSLVSQRLETVMRLLDEQLAYLDDIDAQEVIEEGSADDELDDDDDADEETGLLHQKPKHTSKPQLLNMLGNVSLSRPTSALRGEGQDEEIAPVDRFVDWY